MHTPIPPGTIVEPTEDDVFTTTTAYQSVVGSLLHIANFTRPDISFAVGQLCRFMSAPRIKHFDLAHRVLRFLRQTKSAKIIYKTTDHKVTMYSDADYGNENLVNWWSQRQNIVATSTMEAEITPIKIATQEASYLRQLLYELDPNIFNSTFQLLCDNKSAVHTVNDGGNFGRTKHYIIRINYVRSCVNIGIIGVQHTPAEEMLADALTKPLTREKLKQIFPTSGLSLGSGEC